MRVRGEGRARPGALPVLAGFGGKVQPRPRPGKPGLGGPPEWGRLGLSPCSTTSPRVASGRGLVGASSPVRRAGDESAGRWRPRLPALPSFQGARQRGQGRPEPPPSPLPGALWSSAVPWRATRPWLLRLPLAGRRGRVCVWGARAALLRDQEASSGLEWPLVLEALRVPASSRGSQCALGCS